jgi:hypothetical protein
VVGGANGVADRKVLDVCKWDRPMPRQDVVVGNASTAVRRLTDCVKVDPGRPLLIRRQVDDVIVRIYVIELHSLQPRTVV